MYRIGEFSYLFKVTLKTLRYYDKIGLFSPKKVDKFTGYRYYDESQIEEFKKIMLLKELNFSLDDIKTLKDKTSEEFLNKKLLEANEEITKSKQKIQFLENMLDDGGDHMKYNVGFIPNPRDVAIGRYVNLKSREDINRELEKIFKELNDLKREAGITDMIKVYGTLVINEEIGYKEEDIEMFLGYIVSDGTLQQYKKYMPELRKRGFISWLSKENEGLVVKATKDDNISDIYSSIVQYAQKNNVQINGAFREYRFRDEVNVYVEAYDLNRDNLFKISNKEHLENITKNFKNIPELIGKWKIKEILPGIRFNPNKQKSVPDTKYEILEIMENGKTNYENIRWTGRYLIIDNDGVITYNHMGIIVADSIEYLSINIRDSLAISSNGVPIEYIYEKMNV